MRHLPAGKVSTGSDETQRFSREKSREELKMSFSNATRGVYPAPVCACFFGEECFFGLVWVFWGLPGGLGVCFYFPVFLVSGRVGQI